LTLAFAPGFALAAGQGQDLSEMLASSAAVHATAVSGPLVSVTPLSINFGVVDNGTQGSANIMISNVGDQDLHVSSITSTNPSILSSFGPATITPGSFANATVLFNPTDGMFHSASLTVNSDAANGAVVVSASGQGNAPPVLAPIGNQSAVAFVNLSFIVSAADGDDTNDDPVILSMGSGLPPGATFDANSGLFSWTPTDADGGPHNVTFTAFDGRLTDSEGITINVTVGNRPPVAVVGGPYSGTVGQAILFDGSGSSDPDAGQTLSYSWNFGDGSTATGATASHAYGVAGTFLVILQVCDNGSPQLCASDVASAIIQNQIPVQITLKNNSSTLRTNGGGKELVGIETTLRPLTEIDLTSVRMSTDYPGAGSVSSIAAQVKGSKLVDQDLDFLQELGVYFNRADIRQLLSNVPNNTTINLIISGNFVSTSGSTPFQGVKVVTTKSGGGAVEASAYPNPFNPVTKIAYATKISGPLTMKIYSIDGRLVRTLKESEYTVAGSHEVAWNGIDNAGRHVSSGIYFVRTNVKDDTSIFKLTIAK
jgi:hypothetical protein